MGDFTGYWKHNKKYSGKYFKGSYERDKKGERIFILTAAKGKRRITFESFQMAKKLGWVLNK